MTYRTRFIPRSGPAYSGHRTFTERGTRIRDYRSAAQGRRVGAFRGASFAKPRAAPNKDSGELKGVDTSLAIGGPVIATVTTNADATLLNGVQPGAGSFNRIGRKIFNKSIRLKGICTYTYADETTTESLHGAILRMMVVWDKQPSGTLPTLDEIIGRTSQTGTETSDMMDNLKYDNTERFQILRDVMKTANPAANPPPTAGTEGQIQQRYAFDEFIDLKNRTTVFSGDSNPATIADISSGGLYVYWRANVSTADQIDWSVNGESQARLRFTS